MRTFATQWFKTTLIMVLSSLVLFSACDDDSDPAPTPQPGEPDETIAEIVTGNSNFSTLLTALQIYPDLVQALGDENGEFTVFAPDNDAFNSFIAEDGRFSGVNDVVADTAALRTILQYHVVPGTLTSNDLSDGDSIATLEGPNIGIENNGGSITLNSRVNVKTGTGVFDISATNGVIHGIDNVLLPPSLRQPDVDNIAEIATETDALSSLVQALVRTPGLLETAGDDAADITVFAPTNEAFASLLNTLNTARGLEGDAAYESVDDIPLFVLERVLQYHILAGGKLAADLGTEETTLEGESLTIDATSGVVINDGVNVDGTLNNIEASNGVVHVIDQVLLPSIATLPLGTVLEPAVYNADGAFTTLIAALEEAELVETLADGEATYTVFAPTNDAFADFIAANDGIADAEALLASDALTNILLYHVLGQEVPSSAVPGEGDAPAYLSTLSPGPEETNVSLKAGPGFTLNGNVDINTNLVDITTDNGIVHVLNGVLTPPSVVDLAVNDGRFTELVSALTSADLVGTLSGDGPFTVFAPTDDAFGALESVPTGDDLVNVLLYHVANGNVTAGELSDGDVIETLTGASDNDFQVNVANDGVTITANSNSGDVNIIITDIQGTNGVVHAVDAVLLP